MSDLYEMVYSLRNMGFNLKIPQKEDDTPESYALGVCIKVFGEDGINTNALRRELAKKND